MRLPFTHGGTLLHVAARRNLAGLCRWLLRLGADANRADILGRTALHHAVREGAADAARLLIAHGAGLDAKDWQGRTPLDLAEAGNGEALAGAIRAEISLRHARRVKAVRLARAGKASDAG
jgi:ankyrin repeat protein